MRLGFVLTNFNNSSLTRDAVESIVEIRGGVETFVSVVDNSSERHEVELLQKLAKDYPEVTFIYNKSNLGYFRGLNIGIAHLREQVPDLQYMVVGNNDLIFPKRFGDTVVQNSVLFGRYPVVAPDIVRLDGEHQNPHAIGRISRVREIIYDIYFAKYEFAKLILWIARRTRQITGRRDHENFEASQEIDQGYGACYLLGPLFFRNFERLWAPTFLMGEEFFLSAQVHDKGLGIYYESKICVEHHDHATTNKLPSRYFWEIAKASHDVYRRFKPHGRLGVANAINSVWSRHKETTKKTYQVCTNCIMDTTDPNIAFDGNGMCDHCRDFFEGVKPNWHTDERGRRNLERIVNDIGSSGRGKEFDCILGISGGVDSSYMLHVAVKELGLRPLVFHVDGGWNSEVAVHNINVMINALGLDLYTEVIDWREMRDFQLAFFKSGVPHLDIPQDHAFVATLYHFANKYQIKYILNGGNFSTECVQYPMQWLYYGTDMVHIRDIIRKFGTVPMERYPFSSILWHKLYLGYIRGIKVVKPLNHMPYFKAKAIAVLEGAYGWKRYERKHFESRFTKFYEGYWLPERFGFDTRRVQLSSLILTGQLTRDVAIEEVRKPAYDPESIRDEFGYIATKLGIESEELRQYFVMPRKFYWDYRNQQNAFRAGAVILRLIGAELVRKRKK